MFQNKYHPGSHDLNTSAVKTIRMIGPAVWPVDPFKTDKREKETHRQTDTQTVVTNILCENRRFRKVIMTDRPAKQVICEKILNYFDVFRKIFCMKYNDRWLPVGRKI